MELGGRHKSHRTPGLLMGLAFTTSRFEEVLGVELDANAGTALSLGKRQAQSISTHEYFQSLQIDRIIQSIVN
jgi:hypothetical protein